MPDLITGAIPNLIRNRPMSTVESVNLLISETRFTFARVTPEMIKKAVEQATQAAKASSDGGKSRLWAASAGFRIYERYMGMAPEEVLEENHGNFAVYLSDIRSAKIVDHSDLKPDFRLTIVTGTQGVLTFMVPFGDTNSARETLWRTLGNRFR